MRYRAVSASIVTIGGSLLCFLGMLFSSAHVQAQTPKYDLQYHLLKSHGKTKSVVRVYERRTKRTVWTRDLFELYAIYVGSTQFQGTSDVFWSPNHRAVAFAVRNGASGFSLVSWRAGAYVQITEFPSFVSQDYIEGMLWSPDTQNFLVMTGGSGMADTGHGWLFCVDAIRQKVNMLGDVMEAHWAGSRTIKFWKPVFLSGPQGSPNMGPARQPSFWHIPRPRKL